MKTYNKLVRDKILEILDKKKVMYKTHIADEQELGEKIKEKITEEVGELLVAKNKDEAVQDLADVYEVLDAYMRHQEIKKEAVREVQKKKRDSRGGFEKGIVLESTQ